MNGAVEGIRARGLHKRYGNTIALNEKPDAMKETVRNMMTDPARARRTDPGNPDICPVGDYHDVFSDKNKVAEVDHGCRTAGIGCIQCKMWLFESLQQRLGPIYERRQQLESHPDDVMDILNEGSKKANATAGETMTEVRKAMKI